MPYEFWTADRYREPFASHDIGKVLRAFRTDPRHEEVYGEGRITQTCLGSWLGLGQDQLSRIENGHKPVDSLSTMIEWARKLSIPKEFLWFEYPPNEDEPRHSHAERPSPTHNPARKNAGRIDLATARKAVGLTQEQLAERLHVDRSSVIRWEAGGHKPVPYLWPKLAKILDVSRERLAELLTKIDTPTQPLGHPGLTEPQQDYLLNPTLADDLGDSTSIDEVAALELSRRATSTNVGNATLTQLEAAFDSLAIKYPVTPPDVLLPRIRGHIHYITQLMDTRKTLTEQIRLITIGGWMSLLAATVNIDLKRDTVAAANLQTASSLAKDVDDVKIRAWCYETAAWRAVTDGDYQKAVELSQAAQSLAPSGSSVAIQATAQEGRALARLGRKRETYDVVNRVHRLASTLPRPERPEHHFRYDPDKSTAYTATTLAWAGDPAAESYAREVIVRLSPGNDSSKWPRRVATAKLDLSLALIAANQLDEASLTAQQAILSGRIAPSSRWRAAEIVTQIEEKRIPEAAELRGAFNTVLPPQNSE